MTAVTRVAQVWRRVAALQRRVRARAAYCRTISLLVQHGYRLDGILKEGRVYGVQKHGQRFVFKYVTPAGLTCLRDVLPRVGPLFAHIAVPGLVQCGRCESTTPWVVLTWLEGAAFNHRWDERNPTIAGGRAIGKDTISKILAAIQELHKLPPAEFAEYCSLELTPAILESRLGKWLSRAEQEGWLTHKEIESATRQIDSSTSGSADRVMLSNGDFQFRNFVEMPDGRLGIIDWDTARYSTFELEHCIAYQWLLMWNNPEWQKSFLAAAKSCLPLGIERFRSAMLLNALLRAATFRHLPEVKQLQLSYFRQILRDDWFGMLWDGIV